MRTCSVKNHEKEAKIQVIWRMPRIYFDDERLLSASSSWLLRIRSSALKLLPTNGLASHCPIAEQDAQHLLDGAKYKADAGQAADNAKKVAIETEELKQTRIFHQRLKSTIESQLSIVGFFWSGRNSASDSYHLQTDESQGSCIWGSLWRSSCSWGRSGCDSVNFPEEMAELGKSALAANREKLQKPAITPMMMYKMGNKSSINIL